MRVIDTGTSSAATNMQIDSDLLAELHPDDEPILHLYEWEGRCATFGHFIEPSDFLNLEGCERLGLNLARRPTGGGIIFHLTDWAYSVLVPKGHPLYSLNVMDNYKLINEALIRALTPFLPAEELGLLPGEPVALDESCAHFCMAKPTKYDVMVGGLKVGGAAQRRSRGGFLHQGTISISPLSAEVLSEALTPGTRVAEAMQANGHTLAGQELTFEELTHWRSKLTSEVESALHGALAVPSTI